MHLTRIDELSATIEELSARIETEMRPFAPQIERLTALVAAAVWKDGGRE
jgi:hypothetical protein